MKEPQRAVASLMHATVECSTCTRQWRAHHDRSMFEACTVTGSGKALCNQRVRWRMQTPLWRNAIARVQPVVVRLERRRVVEDQGMQLAILHIKKTNLGEPIRVSANFSISCTNQDDPPCLPAPSPSAGSRAPPF